MILLNQAVNFIKKLRDTLDFIDNNPVLKILRNKFFQPLGVGQKVVVNFRLKKINENSLREGGFNPRRLSCPSRAKKEETFVFGRCDYSGIHDSILHSKMELSSTKDNTGNGFLVTEEELRPFVKDLHQTLSEGSIIQRRGFIHSFIKRIEVDYPQAVIEYNMPIPTKIKDRTSTEEVLSLVQSGVP